MKITLESFLAVIKRSGLIPVDQLKHQLAAFRASSSQPNDSARFAEYLIRQSLLTTWQAEKLLQGKHKGFFLGKYRLLSLLGKGGMSSVYLAEHVLMRRRCAIKVLPAKRVHDSSYLGRFHREAQAVAALDHPNIVRAYDVDHEMDGNIEIHFLVMEYVDGISLLEVVKQQSPVSPIKAAEYIRQAAIGLEHAHRAGLIHRDIKPGNILIDKTGTIKLMDLGLARFFRGEEEGESLTIEYDEKVLGTADYLAPEQAVDSHDIDARADIYSLGCTFYFLLVGHPPFTEGTLAQRLLAHQTKVPSPVSDERKDVSPALLEILAKMMAKKPEDRYQTALEVGESLGAWLQQHGGKEWAAMRTAYSDSNSDIPILSSADFSSADEAAASSAAASPPQAAEPEAEDDALGSFLSQLANEDQSPPATLANKPDTPAETDVDITKQSTTKGLGKPRGKGKKSRSSVKKTTASQSPPAPRHPSPAVEDPPSAIAEVEDIPEPLSDTDLPVTSKTAAWIRGLPRTYLIGGGIGLLALLGIVLGFLFFGGDEQENPSKPQTEIVHVDPNETSQETTGPSLPEPGEDIRVGPEGHFQTIHEALEYLNSHWTPLNNSESRTIRVAGGNVYNERLVINDRALGVLKILSDGDKPAVLKPKGEEPIISLVGSERVEIRGFKLDASGKPVAIRLDGYLASSILANLDVSGFTRVGIDGTGVRGVSQRRFIIQDLRMQAGSAGANGIQFQDVRPTELVDVLRSSFIGPMNTGIDFQQGVVTVRIEQCRFDNLKTGVAIAGVDWELIQFEFENNTLYRVAQGLLFRTPPATGQTVRIVKNLFSQISQAEIASSGNISPELAKTLTNQGLVSHNRSDKTGGSLAWDIFANNGSRGGTAIEFVSTAATEPTYLKPKGNNLKAPAVPGNPTPFVGAIPP